MRIRKKVFTIFAICLAIALRFSAPQTLQASFTKSVYPGGFPIAMVLDIDGAVIDDVGVVKTAVGDASLGNKLKKGDTITEIDGHKITCSQDVVAIVEGGNGDEIILTLLRGGKEKDVTVVPYIESDSGTFRLGVYLRDTVSGVGTVTYVKENGRFCALGHSIEDSVGGEVPIRGGKVFGCEVVGVEKGKRNEAGELKAEVSGQEAIGEVYSNGKTGVFGKFYDFKPNGDMLRLGNRNDVLPGKAYVISTVNDSTEAYEIDVIRALPQAESMPKGLFIRVTDKRLLGICGGIVQGMSGSPIIINGKIVGAVTHVLLNDATKGYGIYVDWMQSA